MPHGEMIAVIARLFNIDESAIGFAGMKDRVAITRQAVSVHLPGFKGDPPPLDHARMQVLWAKRHVNKLRRGHLKGNRFSIRVRDVDPLSVRHVYKRMQAMEKTGVPAYFGDQRFGYRRNNQVCGLAILASQPQVLLDEMLGSRGAPFPARQLPFRRLYEEGKFAESLVGWGRNDRAEKIALQALSKGRDAHRAVRALPEYIKSFWISALQSAIFNANLDARVADGSYAQMIDGDIMFKHDSGACFRASDASADEIAARLISAEISPTGPLHGIGMLQPTGRALDIETLALTTVGTTHEAFLAPSNSAARDDHSASSSQTGKSKAASTNTALSSAAPSISPKAPSRQCSCANSLAQQCHRLTVSTQTPRVLRDFLVRTGTHCAPARRCRLRGRCGRRSNRRRVRLRSFLRGRRRGRCPSALR